MATKEEKAKAAGAPNHEPNPNIVKTKNGELDTTGFVKHMHSVEGTEDADKTAWETLHIDRRFYKPDLCAEFGGLEGYIIDIEQGQADIAKNPKNPQGLFDMIILRATAAFPYVDENKQVRSGSPGEDVILVMTDRLKKLEMLNRHPEKVARVRILPLEKITLKNDRKLWRYSAEMDPKFYERSAIGAEYGLLKALGAGGRTKILKELLDENPAPDAQQASA